MYVCFDYFMALVNDEKQKVETSLLLEDSTETGENCDLWLSWLTLTIFRHHNYGNGEWHVLNQEVAQCRVLGWQGKSKFREKFISERVTDRKRPKI